MQRKYKTKVACHWDIDKKMKVWTDIELNNLRCWDPVRYEEAVKLFPPTYPWENMATQVEIGEKGNGHEVEAYVDYLNVNYQTGLWHKGLASSDLVECWLAWAIVNSTKDIKEAAKEVTGRLITLAEYHMDYLTAGYTHGQQAEPITWGLRLSMWASQLAFAEHMLVPMPGKVSGAVGTNVVTHPDLSALIEKCLGIHMTTLSTQIVPRSQLCMVLHELDNLVFVVSKIANDLRMLFTLDAISLGNPDVGSSSMSHKQNPASLEQVVGLCKLITDMIHSVNTTNMVGWLERDLVHSSLEREALPIIYNHTFYCIRRLYTILGKVYVNSSLIENKTLSSIALADALTHESGRSVIRKNAIGSIPVDWEERVRTHCRTKANIALNMASAYKEMP